VVTGIDLMDAGVLEGPPIHVTEPLINLGLAPARLGGGDVVDAREGAVSGTHHPRRRRLTQAVRNPGVARTSQGDHRYRHLAVALHEVAKLSEQTRRPEISRSP